MDFKVQKFVSNLIENQFPRFYQEEGPNFVLFTKAYYEWLEQKDQPVGEARRLLEYRDIDDTLQPFLSHFQQKYLYGIPFAIISNKRFLLKHILDVYRSKGTIQCYRLLFKLIYNEDIVVYLPGADILKPSDGIWIQPRYLEVSSGNDTDLDRFVGRTIIGVDSSTIAVVENWTKEAFNNDVINVLYLSNITPDGSDFDIGEYVVLFEELNDFKARINAPTVLGSLSGLEVIDGGFGFKNGDLLKIVDQDPFNKDRLSFGRDGLVKVSQIKRGKGALRFNILNNGFGYLANSQVFLYNSIYDETGTEARLDISNVNTTRNIEYNTDLIVDFMNIKLDDPDYPFEIDPTVNINSQLKEAFNFLTGNFGSIYNFSETVRGTLYTQPVDIFVKSTMSSNILPGSIAFSESFFRVSEIKPLQYTYDYTNGDVVTVSSIDATTNAIGIIITNDKGSITTIKMSNFGVGFTNKDYYNVNVISRRGKGRQFAAGFSSFVVGSNGTFFNKLFTPKSMITVIEDNSKVFKNSEDLIVKNVVNSTFMFTYSSPRFNSTANSVYKANPSIIPAQFAYYQISDSNGNLFGENALISGTPTSGNSIATAVTSYNSGKSYLKGEIVKAYPYASIGTVYVDKAGKNYSNGDVVVFSSGGYACQAQGIVITDDVGGIFEVSLENRGSGYQNLPVIYVKSRKGSGAELSCEIEEFDTTRAIIGTVNKKGYGVGKGYWESTKGFLDDDKYIQDSYYFQDFSYEIQTGKTIDVYKPILEQTFHPAGSEMFGKFVYSEFGVSESKMVYEDVTPNTNPNNALFLLSDIDVIDSDTTGLTDDRYFYYNSANNVRCSTTFTRADNTKIRSDNQDQDQSNSNKYVKPNQKKGLTSGRKGSKKQ